MTLKKGSLDALFVVLIWSGFVLISRLGGRSELLPYDVVALRFGTAALILLPYWLARNKAKLFKPKMLALGLTGGVGYCTLAYYGFKHAPAAHAGILLPGLLPFEATLLTWLILGERPSRLRAAGLFIIALGVCSLAMEMLMIGFSTWQGDIAFVAAGSIWALYSILVRKWQISAWDATIGCALISAMIYLPIYAVFLPKQIALVSWDIIALQAFYQGFMAMVVAMVFYMRAMKSLGPSGVGLFMALVPVISGIAAVPLLNEPLTVHIVLGLLLTSIGAWLGSRG